MGKRTFAFVSSAQSLKENRSGFTITGALVGMAIVTLSALTLASLIAFFKANEVRADHRTSIQNILLESMNDLRTASYDDIVTFCTSYSALGADVLSSTKCFATGLEYREFNSNVAEIGPPTQAGQTKPVEQRVNIDTGKYDPNGLACVGIKTCRELVPNQLIEVELVGFWKDPDPKKSPPINSTRQSFRRSRW